MYRWNQVHVFSFWQLWPGVNVQHRPWWRIFWMDIRVGGCGKIPWLSSQCQNTTRGVVWCSRGGDRGWRGEQGPCVQFSPSMRLRLRPRWGWIPCCSACLEAETTWTLLRCPWSSSPALLPKKWPADTSGGSQKHLHTAQGRGLTAMTEDEQAYSVSQQVGWRRRLKGKTSNYVSKRMDRHYCPVACHSTGCIAIKHCGPTQTQRPEDGWEQL